MTRFPDWRGRLCAYLAQVSTRRYRPGQHDCALFVAGAVEVMTGEDLAAGWRGRYRSLDRGRALLADAGHDDMIAFAATRLPEVAPIFARAGDVAVLTDEAQMPAFGLVQGSMIYVVGPQGLGLVSLSAAERAFRV